MDVQKSRWALHAITVHVAATLFITTGIALLPLGSDVAAQSPRGHAAASSATAGRSGFLPGGAMRPHASTFGRHRRRGFGFSNGQWNGYWGSWDSYSGYPGYEPSYSVPYESTYNTEPVQPPAPVWPRLGYSPMGSIGYPSTDKAPTTVHVVPFRPGCDSQTETLPWRDGRERSIRIVRC
jgi:hypothetical protein